MRRANVWVSGWHKLRRQIIERDGYVCLICGMTNDEHLKKWARFLTVNHIDGDLDNNSDENLETLCLPCHCRKDGIRTHISPLLEHKDEIVFLYEEMEYSCPMIAKKFNTSYWSIQNFLKRHGVQLRSRSEANKIRASQLKADQRRRNEKLAA